MKSPFLFLLTVLVIFGCAEKPATTKAYFNIDSLIDAQVSHLIRSKATVSKSAWINEKKDESEFTPDSTTWAHELEAFRYLDLINKPVFANAYAVEDGQNDPNSNLTVRVYRAIKESPVAELRLYYQDTFDRLKKMEATVNEKNALYSSERNLLLEMDNYNGQHALTRYTIRGVQKMILSDTVRFSISSRIAY